MLFRRIQDHIRRRNEARLNNRNNDQQIVENQQIVQNDQIGQDNQLNEIQEIKNEIQNMKNHLVELSRHTLIFITKSSKFVIENSTDIYQIVKEYAIENYPYYQQRFRNYNFQQLKRHFSYLFIAWIIVGIIRYFGRESIHGYSMHQKYYNEKFMWNVIFTFMLSILTHIFIDIFEITQLFSILNNRNLNKFIDNAYFIFFIKSSKDLFNSCSNSFKNLQKIPKIHAQAIMKGRKSLTRHEINNFKNIAETQQQKNLIVHCIEDSFNHILYYLIHFLALMYLFLSIYMIPLFVIVTRIDKDIFQAFNEFYNGRQNQPGNRKNPLFNPVLYINIYQYLQNQTLNSIINLQFQRLLLVNQVRDGKMQYERMIAQAERRNIQEEIEIRNLERVYEGQNLVDMIQQRVQSNNDRLRMMQLQQQDQIERNYFIQAQLQAHEEQRRRKKEIYEAEKQRKNSNFFSSITNLFYKNQKESKNVFKKNTFDWYVIEFQIEQQDLRECPICLIDFEGYENVVGLKCSKMHIYHTGCLQDLMRTGENKCALCRQRIEQQNY